VAVQSNYLKRAENAPIPGRGGGGRAAREASLDPPKAELYKKKDVEGDKRSIRSRRLPARQDKNPLILDWESAHGQTKVRSEGGGNTRRQGAERKGLIRTNGKGKLHGGRFGGGLVRLECSGNRCQVQHKNDFGKKGEIVVGCA